MTRVQPLLRAAEVRQDFDFTRLPSAFFPLVDERPAPECSFGVAMPVCDEEMGIGAALAALRDQYELDGRPMDRASYEVIVLANNCRDRTVPIAREFAAANPDYRLRIVDLTLEPGIAHSGAARRLVMDEVCRRLQALDRLDGIIASTDGDSRVRPDWIAASREEARRGAQAIGGRIAASPAEVATLGSGGARYYRRDLTYRTLRAAYESVLLPDPSDPWPRHHHCFGASFAVTAEAYLAAGGMPAERCLEDLAFQRALDRIGARVRRSPRVGVSTSLRSTGRCEVGLAGTLAGWMRAAAHKEPWMVEAPAAIERRCETRRRIFEAWGTREKAETAVLEVEADWFGRARAGAEGPGALSQLVDDRQHETGCGPYAIAAMEVSDAIAELRQRLAPFRAGLRKLARAAANLK